MNNHSEAQRLAEAVAEVAVTITEIIEARMKSASEAMEQKIARKTVEHLVTKYQAAEHFQVSFRTIENWLKRGYLPHYRIGRIARIRLSDVEEYWKENIS